MGKNRLTAAILAVSLLGLPLAGCSPEERPGPEESVASLADGLSRLDVTGNEFAGSTVEAVNGMLDYEVSGMNIKPSVTVSEIEEVSANEAVATLKYVWDVNASPEDYSYETTVTLERGPDSGWQTRFRSTTVHPDLLPGQRLVRKASPPPRADILGAGGSVLMRHWPVWRVGLDKSVLGGAGVRLLCLLPFPLSGTWMRTRWQRRSRRPGRTRSSKSSPCARTRYHRRSKSTSPPFPVPQPCRKDWSWDPAPASRRTCWGR